MRVLTPTLAFAANFAGVLFRLDGRTIGNVNLDGDYHTVLPFATNAQQDVSSGVSMVASFAPSSATYSQEPPGIVFSPDAPVFGTGRFLFTGVIRIEVFDREIAKAETLADIARRWYYGDKELDLFDGEANLAKEDAKYRVSFGGTSYAARGMRVRENQIADRLSNGYYRVGLVFDVDSLVESRMA